MSLRCIFIFTFLYSFISLFANDSTLTWNKWKKSWGKTEINTSRIDLPKGKNLIKNIEFLDVRGDTERVGVYTNDFYTPYEILLESSINDLLNNKLSNNTARETILLVIRNFWMNEVQYIEGKSKSQQLTNTNKLPSFKLTCSIDAFLNEGQKYFPLTQIDTVFTDKRKITFSSRHLMEMALNTIQNKLEEAISSKRYLAKKQRDKGVIQSAYRRRFSAQILIDSVFPKGIYYTWDQFRKNQPTDKNFSIKSNKGEPPSLFINENGNEILTNNAFAVSDGYKLYKVHHGFVFPIYINYGGIYWMGLEQFDQKTYGAPAAIPLGGGWFRGGLEAVSSAVKIRLSPYLLNLETGVEY